jgi:restriction system protein
MFILGFGVALLVGFVAGRSIPSRQNVGEAMVANAIAAGLQRPHLLLNNVTLPVGEGSTQIDHVLVTDIGIFVIETKHYGGWIFGDVNRSHWTQVIFRKKSKFQNPVRQNYGHVKALQALFTLPANAFTSLVVFTGDVEFKTDLGPTVLKLHKLIEYLEAKRAVLFDERQMTYIVGRIEMKRMRRSIETDEYHVNYVRRRVKALAPHSR